MPAIIVSRVIIYSSEILNIIPYFLPILCKCDSSDINTDYTSLQDAEQAVSSKYWTLWLDS